MRGNNKTPKITDTLIGQGSQFNGKLQCEANVRIDGRFQGEIESAGQITVGETGEVHSDISGIDVTVAGKIYGDVITKNRLLVTATGQIHGNVTTQTLIIIEGGMLNGGSMMESAQAIPSVVEKIKKGKAPITEAVNPN